MLSPLGVEKKGKRKKERMIRTGKGRKRGEKEGKRPNDYR